MNKLQKVLVVFGASLGAVVVGGAIALMQETPRIMARMDADATRTLAAASAKYWAELEMTAAQKKIMMGMPADLVEKAWGAPEKRNKTVFPEGTREQWVYPGYNYVYFVNGRVASWQTSK